MVQWLRIRLPVHGTRVLSLVQEDPHATTKTQHSQRKRSNKESQLQTYCLCFLGVRDGEPASSLALRWSLTWRPRTSLPCGGGFLLT